MTTLNHNVHGRANVADQNLLAITGVKKNEEVGKIREKNYL